MKHATNETATPRVYLDNAATSFPKAPGVGEAMASYATRLGASPGRGAYAESVESAGLVAACRSRLAGFLGADPARPEQVVFTLNTTDALNLAIKGVVLAELARREAAGDATPVHVVTTWMDHNSVLRPINGLIAAFPGRVEQTRVRADERTGLVDPDDVASAIRPGTTALVATVHASNVTGTLQPIGAIAEVCARAGVLFAVDAAQSAGHVHLNVCEGAGIDLLAVPGHKGLLGPLGTGALYIRPGVEERMLPLREGGTGSVSEQDTQPASLPDRFESGSHNTPGIVGLGESLSWVASRGIDDLRAHELERIGEMLDGLGVRGDSGACAAAPGLRLLGPVDPGRRVGVFALAHEWIEPAALAMVLEERYGVLARAGLHCAPLVHRTFGTADAGGALRLSVGPFTSADDVRTATAGLCEVCAQASAVV